MNTLDYIESSRKQFEYYKLLAEKTFAQLTDEQLNWRSDEEANSISIIVMHLHGNMLSRWTDFLSTDGEKEWRKREEEFELQANDRAHILSLWNQGWACLFSALDSVNNENADTLIYIRKMGHSITEAVNRQLAHYAYHVGQIVFIGRMLKGNEWASLSIPKGHSQVYNQEKFSQEKRKEHFTDQILKDKESKK
jgi:hypothetical protein